MHGCGNDFVIIDARISQLDLSKNQIKTICDRRFGVGCDQFVVITNSKKCDCAVVFYNSDGSESGACGNASRCVAKIIMDEKNSDNITIESSDRTLKCKSLGDDVISIEMGDYTTNNSLIPLDENINPLSLPKIGEFQEGLAIGVGNPHAIYFVKNLDKIIDLQQETINKINGFFPKGVNISLVEIVNDGEIKQKVWERGAGLTLSCGTGACAATAACVIAKKTTNKLTINQPGGQLKVEINGTSMTMSGKVTKVFQGDLIYN